MMEEDLIKAITGTGVSQLHNVRAYGTTPRSVMFTIHVEMLPTIVEIIDRFQYKAKISPLDYGWVTVFIYMSSVYNARS